MNLIALIVVAAVAYWLGEDHELKKVVANTTGERAASNAATKTGADPNSPPTGDVTATTRTP